jgi:hypothetical protein
MDMPDPEAAQELGSLAHGPLLLAAVQGVAVGLRRVVAHRTGLPLAPTSTARSPTGTPDCQEIPFWP